MTTTPPFPDDASETAVGSADCDEALQRLFEFLDSELDERDCDRIRLHLADCEPCLAEFDAEDHLKKLVRRSCQDTAPQDLHLRIRAQLTVLRAEVDGSV